MNTGEWKNDPRLANMDPFKLQYIETLAKQISSQSKEHPSAGKCETKITSKVKTTVQQSVNSSMVSTITEIASKSDKALCKGWIAL